mmetsp:Transcript_4665/g.8889  ORF Transcript_4665/g.8889 Transcript_4665/m.8889 type:complete len:687 (-) Transcript_4665:7-2067(-)|eukprot:scaffold7349_cov173-Amphora_coffeaeformis.AAC.1
MKNHETNNRLKKRQRLGRITKEVKSLRVISSVLAMMGSFSSVTSLPRMEAHQIISSSSNTNDARQAYRLGRIGELIRGGATAADEDDKEAAELDAYIEQLLGEVDGDNNNDEDAKVERTKSKKETPVQTDMKSSKSIGTDRKAKFKATGASTLKKKSSSASSSMIRADEKKASVTKKAKTKPTKTHKAKTGLKSGSTTKFVETVEQPAHLVNQTEHTVDVKANATAAATSATTIPSLPSDNAPQLRRRPPPPNALYRFLLRRAGGFGGRSTVLLLVTTSEFLHTYLPPIANVGDWVLSKILPTPKDGIGRRRRPDRPASSSANVASVSRMARTGVSRSKRRKFTQQADQIALAQLQQRPTAELRYTFCSEAFCRRHGLGKRASSANKYLPSETDNAVDVDVEEEYFVQEHGVVGSKLAKKWKKKQDWVLVALSKEPRRQRSPTLTLGMGSDGLTIGVDLDWSGQKDRVKVALTLPPKSSKVSARKQLNTTPRKSDSDGGMVGRLRAAAGSSMRSLSGAYPGDALSADAAGNSLGLGDFAAKYGYGDWSESDDDDLGPDDVGGGIGSKRRRRRRKSNQNKDPGKFWDNIDVSFSSGSSSDGRRRDSPRTNRPEIPLSTSPTLSRRKRSESSSHSSLEDQRMTPLRERSSKSPAKVVAPRKTIMAKSPLSRTNELKKKVSDCEKSNDD